MVDYKYAELFMRDSIDKQLQIMFDSGTLTNTDINSESFELKESLCSGKQLKFGSCESASVKFKTSRADVSFNGKWLEITEILEGKEDAPFCYGKYKVKSDKLTSDRKSRDIIAYDKLYDINTADITEWYNGIVFPVTVKQLRDLFFEHFETVQMDADLPNDNILIQKSDYYSSVKGEDVICDICEVNGCFGRMGRTGQFEYVFLSQEENNISKYKDVKYEDFATKKIDQILVSQGSSGTDFYYGEGNNTYVFRPRILQFGKDATVQLAATLFDIISVISYIPATIRASGNPCLECGDRVTVSTKDGDVCTYILQRSMKGTQSHSDEYVAEGDEYYSNSSKNNREVMTYVNGKIAKVYRDSFYAYTYTNSMGFQITEKDRQVIVYNITATSDTYAILIATVPIVSDRDGNLVVNYYQDGVLSESKQMIHYINKGYNLVTFCNYFAVNENKRLSIGVAVHLEGCESILRQQSAKISSILDYISTGTYTEKAVDTTAPGATIAKQAIKAVLYAQGLSGVKEWDGTITILEEMKRLQLAPLEIRTFAEHATAETQIPLGGIVTQAIGRLQLDSLVLRGFTEEIGSGEIIEFVVTQQKVEFAGTDYTETVDGVTKLRTEYVVESVTEEIDTGYMSSVEIVTDGYQSVESVVVE